MCSATRVEAYTARPGDLVCALLVLCNAACGLSHDEGDKHPGPPTYRYIVITWEILTSRERPRPQRVPRCNDFKELIFFSFRSLYIGNICRTFLHFFMWLHRKNVYKKIEGTPRKWLKDLTLIYYVDININIKTECVLYTECVFEIEGTPRKWLKDLTLIYYVDININIANHSSLSTNVIFWP